MGYSILQKMARGASAAGAEGYMVKFKEELLATRAANLQSFQTSERVAGQTFLEGENALNRTAQTVRDVATADYRTAVLEQGSEEATRTADYRKQGLINQGLQLDITKLTAEDNKKLTKIKTEMAELQLDHEKDRQKAYKMLKGIADPEMQKDILRWLNQTSGKSSGVIIKRKVNKDGIEINDFYVFDKETGARLDEGLSFDDEKDPLSIRGK